MFTPRQRVQAILNRQPVDRIPIDLWYTQEVLDSLYARFGVHDEIALARAMGTDKIFWIGLPYKGPMRPPEAEGEICTPWGNRYKMVRSGAALYAEYAEHPLAGYETPEQLNDYPWWPDPEKFDYEEMTRQARAYTEAGFATLGPWVSLFEVYCGLRGLEQALMDVLINPDLVHAILDRLFTIQGEILRRFYAMVPGLVDMAFISDDMGSQSGLLMSLDSWDIYIKDRLTAWCELIHSYGIKVFYHSDGAVGPLVPRLIEAGVDVLNPIQHVCPTMEMSELKKQFGQQLIFHGAVENQKILPFGTAEEVAAEARACLAALASDGAGYLGCSCHNIQAGTPVENILAMVEVFKQQGGGRD